MNFHMDSQGLYHFDILINPKPYTRPACLIHAFEDDCDDFESRNCACDRLDLFVDGGETAHFRNLTLSRSYLNYLNERKLHLITVRMVAQGKVPINIVTDKKWQRLVMQYELNDIITGDDLIRDIYDVYYYSDESLVVNTQQAIYANVQVDIFRPKKLWSSYMCIFANFVPQLIVGRNSGEFHSIWLNDALKPDNRQLLAFVPLKNPRDRMEKLNIFHETMERYQLEESVLSFVVNDLDMHFEDADLSPYYCAELLNMSYINSANSILDILSFLMFTHATKEPEISSVFTQLVDTLPVIEPMQKEATHIFDIRDEDIADKKEKVDWTQYSYSDLQAFLDSEQGYHSWSSWQFNQKHIFDDENVTLRVNCSDQEWKAYNYFITILSPIKALHLKFLQEEGNGLINCFVMYESLVNYYYALKLVWKDETVTDINGTDYSFLVPPVGLDQAKKDAVLQCVLCYENIFEYYHHRFFNNPLPWVAITLNPTMKFQYIEEMFPEKAETYKNITYNYLDHYCNHEYVKSADNDPNEEFHEYLARPHLDLINIGEGSDSIVKYWFDRKELWPELSVLAVAVFYMQWHTTTALHDITQISDSLIKANGRRLKFPIFELLVKIKHHMMRFGMC